MNKCNIDNCYGKRVSKGLCQKHYSRDYNDKNKRYERTPEYRAWENMKQRCYNPRGVRAKRYYQRGIIVCDRWLESFDNFIKDVGLRPNKFFSLDRINNDGNYEPNNVRWANPREQAGNTSIVNSDDTPGVKMRNNKWVASISYKNRHIYLGTFDDFDSAMNARLMAEEKYTYDII